MIPFPFNENWFSFLVADHLRVGQLCTNSKSDRSLLSCLKGTQCSTSEIGDAPLYKSCSLPIQVMTTGSKLWQRWIATNNRDVPRVMKTRFPATFMVFGVVSSEGHIMPLHIFEVGLKVTPKCTWKFCWVWWYPDAIRWPVADPGCGSRIRLVQKDPGLTSVGVLRLCTLLSLPPSSPDLNPLDYFVWSYVENSLIAATRRVFAEFPPALVEKACS